jgi:hypothetical protein
MRAGVIAALPIKHIHIGIVTHSINQSKVTHSDIRSHWASFLIALTTFIFAKTDYDKRIIFNHTVPDFVLKVLEENKKLVWSLLENETDSENFVEKTEQFFGAIKLIISFLRNNESVPRSTETYSIMIQILASYAAKFANNEAKVTGSKNFALESPIASFATAIFFGHNFPLAIKHAIHLGGDTDTVASMVGQIVGAYHGINLDWWDYNFVNGNITITPVSDRAKQNDNIPLDWFLPLKVKWQLFHRAMRLSGIAEYRMPCLFNLVGDDKDKQFRELIVFEKEWTLIERNKKKLIQEYFGKISSYKREALPKEVSGIRRYF